LGRIKVQTPWGRCQPRSSTWT